MIVENKALVFSLYSQFIDHRYHLHSLQPQVVLEKNFEYTYCVYDLDITTCYVVGEFLFLFVSHVLIMYATKCLCCGRSLRTRGSRPRAIFLFIATWKYYFPLE